MGKTLENQSIGSNYGVIESMALKQAIDSGFLNILYVFHHHRRFSHHT